MYVICNCEVQKKCKAYVEIIREEIRNICPDIKRVLHVLSLIGCRVNSEFCSVYLCELLRKHKIANDKASKVCHHGHALLERHLGKPRSGRVLDLQPIRRPNSDYFDFIIINDARGDLTCRSSGMLLKATYLSDGRTSVVENVDLKEGSSKQGNADRASVG